MLNTLFYFQLLSFLKNVNLNWEHIYCLNCFTNYNSILLGTNIHKKNRKIPYQSESIK